MAYISCDRQGSPEEQNQHGRDTGECGLPRWLVEKSLPANAGGGRHARLIPELRISSGGGNGNPLRYSCLENPMDRGARWASVHRILQELDTTQWLNNNNNRRLRGIGSWDYGGWEVLQSALCKLENQENQWFKFRSTNLRIPVWVWMPDELGGLLSDVQGRKMDISAQVQTANSPFPHFLFCFVLLKPSVD